MFVSSSTHVSSRFGASKSFLCLKARLSLRKSATPPWGSSGLSCLTGEAKPSMSRLVLSMSGDSQVSDIAIMSWSSASTSTLSSLRLSLMLCALM